MKHYKDPGSLLNNQYNGMSLKFFHGSHVFFFKLLGHSCVFTHCQVGTPCFFLGGAIFITKVSE